MRLSYSGLVCLPSKEDIVSSNLISRSTVNAFTKSFLLQLILDTRIGYLGSFFVILEIFAGHILRQWCMECDVGWYSRQRRRRLLQFLRARRSPYTYNSYYEYYAWYVTSSGRVVDDYTYGVLNSYGRRSPSTGSSRSAWPVGPSGFVFDYDGNYVGYDSYGNFIL